MWLQPLAVVGMAVAAVWFGAAVLSPWIAPHDPLAQSTNLFQPPSGAHLFGTVGQTPTGLLGWFFRNSGHEY